MSPTLAVLALAGAVGVAGCGASGTGASASNTAPAVAATTTGTVRPTTTTEGITTPAALIRTTTAATTATGASISDASGTDTTPDLPGADKPTVLLGDMNTPEQFIVGAIYQDALQAQGYHVDLSRNVGPTSVSEAAIAQGSLDIYPEYLNTYDTQVAGSRRRYTTLQQAFVAAQLYANTHGQTLLTPTPFSNTAGIAVLRSYARAHHLTDISDLRRVATSLTFGSPLEFSADPAGLPALEQAYKFIPNVTVQTNIGSQYSGLKNGTLQAVYVQTTDWQLAGPLFTALRDNKHVLGFGNVVPVVRSAALDAEGPAFADAINQVDALLTTEAVRGLAAEMTRSPDPATSAGAVAQEFLQGYGILPPPPWSTVTTTTPLATTGTPVFSTPDG